MAKCSSQWDGVQSPWQLHRLKVKVTGEGHGIYPWILSAPCLLLTLKGFVFNWDKFSSWCDSMHDPWLYYADSRLRSQLKVMGYTPFYLWKNIIKLCSNTCLSQWDSLQNLWLSYADSRSQLEVMGFSF